MRRVSVVFDRSRQDAHPLHRAVIDAATISTATVLTWDASRPTPTTLSRLDAPPSVVEPLVNDLSAVDDYALSDDDGATYAFVQQEQFEMAPRLADAVAASGILALPPITYREDGTIEFTFVGTHDALQTLFEKLETAGDYEITSVGEYGSPAGRRRLTPRQREALKVAVSVGYYDVPRTGSMSEVGATLDCSESTASELVRKAQAAVVTGFVE